MPKKEELTLVFDIGSSSVKAALFSMQKSGVPKIIASFREPIALEDNIQIERFLSLTIQALDTVAGNVFAKRLGAPSKIFCVLSSPWHISQTRVIHIKKENPFVFSTALADDLIKKESTLLQKEYIEKYPHVDNTLRLIELKNIQITLNGYETPHPIGKKAKEAEITVFMSMTEEQVCKKVEMVIRKHFSVPQIQFSSFTLACFTVLRDLFTHQDSFLLINIGGEITDITMIKNNTLRESTSFPLGINFMIRSLATALKCPLSEAKSLLSLFKDGHAGGESTLLESTVLKLKSDWLAQFEQSLAHLSHDISIPAYVYITVDKDLSQFFSEIIRTEQFNQFTLTESKFQIVFLNYENLQGIASFQNDSIFNAFLAVDSMYINRYLSQ